MYKDKKPLWAYIFKKEKLNLVHYRIVPDYTIENTQNEVISKAIASIYRNPKQRIKISLKPIITIKPKTTVFFNILIEKSEANFYISFDAEYEEYFLNKMQSIWNKSAFIKVKGKELQNFDINNTEMCELVLRDFNFKSLNCDKGNLYPLTNMLGITKVLKGDERIRVNYTIEPIKRTNWISMSKDEYKHFKEGKTIDNSKTWLQNLSTNLFSIVEWFINIYIDFRILLFESIAGLITMGEQEEEKQNINIKIDSLEEIKKENKLKGLSSYTHHKITSEAFKVAISILSQSKDCNRRYINLVSVANSYKDLNGDNELIVRKTKNFRKKMKNVIYFNSISSRANKSIYSGNEVAKFIQLPQRTLLQEYDIEHIDTREIEVPIDLQKLGIEIGTAEHKREELKVYWCNEYNSMASVKVIAGPPGAGKSKYTSKFIVLANRLGHATFVFDYIKNCGMAKESMDCTKNNVIIDMTDINNLPSLSYPEVSNLINENSTAFERIDIASKIAKQVRYLIDAITDDATGPLTAPMRRFLTAACKVVFIHPNEKIDNVFKVLEDWKVRNEYIRKTKCVYDYDDRILNTLRELNETDENGKVIGTRYNLIQGILNRIEILTEDNRLELMLKKDTDSHDFVRYMNEGKAVYFLMPQVDFDDPLTKDIIVTYFMTRIRIASLLRSHIDKPNIAHLITDEVHHIPTAAKFLANHINEFRKFGIAPFFTVHHFAQFKHLLKDVKSSNISYMLLAGIEKENIISLKEEISPFTVEEVLELKPFHSLNIIKYKNQTARFISKLPKPIK